MTEPIFLRKIGMPKMGIFLWGGGGEGVSAQDQPFDFLKSFKLDLELFLMEGVKKLGKNGDVGILYAKFCYAQNLVNGSVLGQTEIKHWIFFKICSLGFLKLYMITGIEKWLKNEFGFLNIIPVLMKVWCSVFPIVLVLEPEVYC